MPAFNPTGFQIKSSEIVTSPAKQNVSTYFWNPLVNGYSGDMLVPYLTSPGETGDESGVLSQGFVYPVPAQGTQPPGLPTPTVNPTSDIYNFPLLIPTLGVALQFSYWPKGASGPVKTPNFLKDTQLQANTAVQVDVICDYSALYDVQIYAPDGIDLPSQQATSTSATGSPVFCGAAIFGLEYEEFTSYVSTEEEPKAAGWFFVKGNAESNYNGGSGQGIYIQSEPPLMPTGSVYTVYTRGVDTSISGNQYNTITTSAGPGVTYSNPIMLVQQSNQWLVNNMYANTLPQQN
jgi:hypothetical protein